METKDKKLELLGKTIGMTQVFDENNRAISVTVVEIEPSSVVQVKTIAIDGYDGVQLGTGKQKKHRVSKSVQGHCSKANLEEPVRDLYEFRTEMLEAYNIGDKLTVECFEEGQKVDVTSKTKGRGFQGVVKRYGFAGGPASHGHMSHRRGGSYGHCQWPGEVQKGKKMPGHMGDVFRTVQNLVIVRIIKDKNLLLIAGSCPGHNGCSVKVRVSKKQKRGTAPAA